MRRALLLIGGAVVFAVACGRERDMPERVEMPDSAEVMRAMTSEAAMDSMLDTIPGGEMARGDSAAAAELLKKKM
ncbi:MAG: hypothetical protein PVJ64_02135 [Gemmatimonadales bacterium]|jgi:hypothetical protein